MALGLKFLKSILLFYTPEIYTPFSFVLRKPLSLFAKVREGQSATLVAGSAKNSLLTHVLFNSRGRQKWERLSLTYQGGDSDGNRYAIEGKA